MEQTPLDTSASDAQNTVPSMEGRLVLPKRRIDPPKNTVSELSHEQQLKLVAMIAAYKSNADIVKKVSEDFGVRIPASTVNYYRYSAIWADKREKFREEFNSNLAEEEFASKRRRIQELTRAYKRLEKEDSTLVDATNVLAKIREEIEGKLSREINVTQYNQYNQMTDEELIKTIHESSRYLKITESKKGK